MKRKWLKMLRVEADMTCDGVGKAVGVSAVTYSLYESGKRNPKPEVAMKIGDLLGFDWTRFYDKAS